METFLNILGFIAILIISGIINNWITHIRSTKERKDQEEAFEEWKRRWRDVEEVAAHFDWDQEGVKRIEPERVQFRGDNYAALVELGESSRFTTTAEVADTQEKIINAFKASKKAQKEYGIAYNRWQAKLSGKKKN